jgi:hypothetical protein
MLPAHVPVPPIRKWDTFSKIARCAYDGKGDLYADRDTKNSDM